MVQRPVLLSLQYLRAIAATAVVVFHTEWSHTVLGAAGVDIFFVISGFVMAMVGDRAPSPRAFITARALRIVPLYWLVTVAQGVAGHESLRRILLSIAFIPHLDPKGNAWPVVIPGWTLNYGVFFYVLVTGLLFAPYWIRLWALGLALLALVVSGLVLHPVNVVAITYTNPILLEFMAGIVLHRAWRRGWLRSDRIGVGLFGLGVVSLLAQFTWPAPEAWRLLQWGLPASLIVAGSLGIEAGGRMPVWPWLSLAGSASYAVYLMHGTVLHHLQSPVRPLPAPVAVGMLVVACLVVGVGVHFLIERPVTAALRRLLTPARVAAVT